jgi:large subunit ribosomal protein L24
VRAGAPRHEGKLAVQTTLLGLAIALIVTLVSALLAPLVVDWNRYRSAFEAEASRLTGFTVRVNGSIDASILPTPRIKLHDVEVGEPGRPPQMQASFIELEVRLGPLLRGEVQASEMHVIAPRISLGLDGAGAIDWPKPSPSFRADALTISRFRVEDGALALTDARSGLHLALQKFSFDGDVRSFLGPFHGEGAFAVGDEPFDYRISGNQVDEDGGLKLRLSVNPTNHPLTTEVDGTLRFDGSAPQFDGTLALTRPVGVTLAGGERVMSDPWQFAGKVHATSAAASLQDLALQYGPDERAVNVTGKGVLSFGAHPHLDGSIAAVQFDVDRMLAAPDVTHRPPFVMLKGFLETFAATVKPPLPLAVTVTINAMTVGGATLQTLHGNVGFNDKGWSLNDFAFRAPGFTDISVSGRLGNGPQGLGFSGPASLQSADLKELMAWLEGRSDQPAGSSETFNARGDVTIASGRFAFDHLSATLDQENVEGRLAYIWAVDDHPAALDGELHATKLNVDALIAFAKAAASDDAFEVPRKVALVLNVGRATFAGVDARMVDARVNFDSGIMHIDRLSVGDLGGAAFGVSGRIDELSSQPRGQLTLDVAATSLAGLTGVVGKFAPQVADSLRPFADRLAPAKVHGVLTIDRAPVAGTTAKFELGGDVGALRLTLNGSATGDAAHPDAAVVHITSRLDADDGGALVRLLNLDRVLAVDQLPGQMTIAANGPLKGDVQINGLAAAGGFSAAATGTLHVSGDQAPTGSMQLKASASDLRPLHRALTGQPGSAVPVSASAIVGVAGADLSATDLILGVDKTSLRGRLDLKLASPLAVSGDISADNVDAAAAAAMLLGLPSAGPGAAKPWSSAPFGAGAFAALSGDVNFTFDRVILAPTLLARGLTGVLHVQPSVISLTALQGKLGDGRLTGALTFRRDGEKLAAQGNVELDGANAAAFIATSKNSVDGMLTVKLEGDGLGLSPDSLVGSFRGSGTLSLSKAQFAGIDPAAFDAATRAADQSGSTESAKIAPVVEAAMEKGRLLVPQGNAEVTIAAGQIHLANTNLHARGGAELALDGVVDLNKSAIDAHLVLSEPPAANAMIGTRPEIAVGVKGTLAAPERRLDVSALVGWLTMRATEQQTRRLESIEANQRLDLSRAAPRPASPSIRFIPQGTPLEVTPQANAVASPPGARGFERLRSEAPPPLPRPAPGQSSGADKATATATPPPQPALRSPLDLLFRSQN